MLKLFKKKTSLQLSTKETVDIIESAVAPYLKENGFKKHGRTYCRFVDNDIAQVVNFQNGCAAKGVTGILWINLGIRVPECVERKFKDLPPLKKYYHEYECNIRCVLGKLTPDKNDGYDLTKNPEKIAKDIIKNLKKYAMPVFDKLNSRENILLYRRDHRKFDWLSHLRIFEEAMIYGKMGDIEKATDLFNTHYSISVEEIRSQREINGETICGSRIWSTPNFNHIDYLEELADELEIRIIKPLDRNNL